MADDYFAAMPRVKQRLALDVTIQQEDEVVNVQERNQLLVFAEQLQDLFGAVQEHALP